MLMQTMHDVPLLIISPNSSSERRITPAWTIAQLKSKLEPVTGIPPSSQIITLRTGNGDVPVEAADEESTQIAQWSLTPYAELHVADRRPPGQRGNFDDVSAVDRYIMPVEEYESKTDSVLAYKKAHGLGRFAANAEDVEAARTVASRREAEMRGVLVGGRCRVAGDDGKRGTVRYVGKIPEIPGGAVGVWVGVQLDEPVGMNDGAVGGRRFWGVEGGLKDGMFVRPEKLEMGDWEELDELGDLEEI